LGRIYEETGRKDQAEAMFKEIIDLAPYDFYAIRARMHLNEWTEASKLIWPDQKTQQQLKSNYHNSRMTTKMYTDSKYYQRLHFALETGIYSLALTSDSLLRKKFPSRRPKNISLPDLDEYGLFASIGLLIALRQDALAANATDKRLNTRLQIAGAIGIGAGDWPLALSMAAYHPKTQKDVRFLGTAFPPIYLDLFKKTGAEYSVNPSLLYSIVREESCFYPAAVSSHGALGLFQFMPSTFNDIVRKHPHKINLKGSPSKEAFLMDPRNSVKLGGFWFGHVLNKNQKGNVLFSILEHHAGDSAVKQWRRGWEASGVSEDAEYIIETVRYLSTRNFVRQIVRDMAIVESAELFSQ